MPACVVCREGYTLRPGELLAAYCFCKRGPAHLGLAGTVPFAAPGEGGSGSSAPPSPGAGQRNKNVYAAAVSATAGPTLIYSTVSHFHMIHVSCHVAARRADSALRVPKREWEGATLRNGETLCNNLLPLRGPQVNDAAYAAACATFFENLEGLGRVEAAQSHARLHAVAQDLAALLLRFAAGPGPAALGSFSADCRGGGRESNAQLAVCLVQLGRHLAATAGPSGRADADTALAAFVSGAVEAAQGRPPASASPGRAPASAGGPASQMLALSLLLMSPEDWQRARVPLLRAALRQGWAERSAGEVQQALAALSDEQLLGAARPALAFWGLVDRVHQLIRPPRAAAEAPASSGWQPAVMERMHDVPALMSGAREMLDWLASDLETADSAQEALDVLEVLGDVLGGGGSCEAWLRAAMSDA